MQTYHHYLPSDTNVALTTTIYHLKQMQTYHHYLPSDTNVVSIIVYVHYVKNITYLIRRTQYILFTARKSY